MTQVLRTTDLGRAGTALTLSLGRSQHPTRALALPPRFLSIYRKMKQTVRKLIVILLLFIRILECSKEFCWESSWLPRGMPSDHDPWHFLSMQRRQTLGLVALEMSTGGRQYSTLSVVFPLLLNRASLAGMWEADRQHSLIAKLGVVVLVIREMTVEGV